MPPAHTNIQNIMRPDNATRRRFASRGRRCLPDRFARSVQPAPGLLQLGPIMRFSGPKTADFSRDRSKLRLGAYRLDRSRDFTEAVGMLQDIRQAARRSHCLSGPPSFQRQTCHVVRRLGCRTLPMLPPRALRRMSSGVAQSQCFVAFTNRSANTPAHAVPPAKARRPGRVERVRQEKGADDGVRIR